MRVILPNLTTLCPCSQQPITTLRSMRAVVVNAEAFPVFYIFAHFPTRKLHYPLTVHTIVSSYLEASHASILPNTIFCSYNHDLTLLDPREATKGHTTATDDTFNMSETGNTTEIKLVIVFGIFSLFISLASLHYKDSLCCLCFHSLHRVCTGGRSITWIRQKTILIDK